ncbi:hypothetical protein [Nocardioides sp. J54]|uniref:hypothetical protein n=1 Tax=Nocardioides sp. J54 TaxID=935866 RepID=UPI0012FA3660
METARSPRCSACPWWPTSPTIRRRPPSTTAARTRPVTSRQAPTSGGSRQQLSRSRHTSHVVGSPSPRRPGDD